MPVTQYDEAETGRWQTHRSSGIEYLISGDFSQVLEIRPRNTSIFSQAGSMTWMCGAEMKVSGSGGGNVSRVLGGSGFFLASFEGITHGARVGFAPARPGSIVPYFLEGTGTILCERGAFLAAESGVELGGAVQKNLKVGIFGGEGVFLQAISGRGMAFLSCAGTAVEHDLGSGENLLVNPGHVAFLEDSVRYEVEAVRGVRNILLGGEGLFLARLSGPGKVWTQTQRSEQS